MALRQIRINEDEILRKTCRVVESIDSRIKIILDDMLETMYKEEGVGLAGPQVGILKRLVVVDVHDEHGPLKLINPKIIESEGTQTDYEGCLSIPNKRGIVERPSKVVVKALNENGEEITVVGTDFLARALCHEIDHLDGILYIDKVTGEVESKHV